jgi:hypothetical protein
MEDITKKVLGKRIIGFDYLTEEILIETEINDTKDVQEIQQKRVIFLKNNREDFLSKNKCIKNRIKYFSSRKELLKNDLIILHRDIESIYDNIDSSSSVYSSFNDIEEKRSHLKKIDEDIEKCVSEIFDHKYNLIVNLSYIEEIDIELASLNEQLDSSNSDCI